MTKTLQEAFDDSLNFIRDQKYKPSRDPSSLTGIYDSRYKNKEGLGCGIFPLLKQHYTPSLENNNVGSDIVLKAISDSGYSMSESAKKLYDDLQHAHDMWLDKNNKPPSEYEIQMENIARKYDLTYNPPSSTLASPPS